MSLFKRMSQFFSKLFSEEAREKPPMNEREFILQQKKSAERIASTLTEMIFQRKKMEAQISQLKNEGLHIEEDLVTAADQDNDSIAIYLMERQQEVQKEIEHLQTQLLKVEAEIGRTKELKSALASQTERSKIQFSVLKSRKEALMARKKLEQDFQSVSGLRVDALNGLQGMDEEILKLEASLESMDVADSDRQQEVRQLRRTKNEALLKSQWMVKKAELKKQLNKRLLPPAIEVSPQLRVHQVVGTH